MIKKELYQAYKPYKGFYDLREWDLPANVFKKLWQIQDMLNHYNTHAEYYRKYEPSQWGEAQNLSGMYQQILFSYKRKGDLNANCKRERVRAN